MFVPNEREKKILPTLGTKDCMSQSNSKKRKLPDDDDVEEETIYIEEEDDEILLDDVDEEEEQFFVEDADADGKLLEYFIFTLN